MGVLELAYKTAMEKPLRVLDIFNEFFGESRVDMQGFPTLAEVESVLPEASTAAEIRRFIIDREGFILVHFPHVRITNENDRYTDIKHLYAKVIIDINGTIHGRFGLNRAEYTVMHFTNNYMHSHVSIIPTHNLTEFQIPCTGSGPINNTICSLAREFDEDLWRLFCLELDKYVQVESIAGTPYHRLESLVAGGRTNMFRSHDTIKAYGRIVLYDFNRNNRGITIPQLAAFTKYVIDSNILKFTYQEDGYYLAMSPTKYYILISNAFIKWYNEKYKKHEVTKTLSDLLSAGILEKLKFVDNHLVRERNGYLLDYHSYIGRKICTFKGQDVLLSISDAVDAEVEENNVYILKQSIAEYIFTKIFNVLNFRYGNNKNPGDNQSCKKVYYL